MQIDETTEQFIMETLNREFNRLIAKVLSDYESFTESKEDHKRVAKIVKDVANTSKRVMFSQITKTEVEPRYYGGSGNN